MYPHLNQTVLAKESSWANIRPQAILVQAAGMAAIARKSLHLFAWAGLIKPKLDRILTRRTELLEGSSAVADCARSHPTMAGPRLGWEGSCHSLRRHSSQVNRSAPAPGEPGGITASVSWRSAAGWHRRERFSRPLAPHDLVPAAQLLAASRQRQSPIGPGAHSLQHQMNSLGGLIAARASHPAVLNASQAAAVSR